MAEMKTLNELFIQKLRYVYDAEQRLTEALPTWRRRHSRRR